VRVRELLFFTRGAEISDRGIEIDATIGGVAPKPARPDQH
jgi:hypothetical protein